jgi:hypothetical protein
LPPRALLTTGNINQNPFQRQIWFTFGHDSSPRRALPAGNINQGGTGTLCLPPRASLVCCNT